MKLSGTHCICITIVPKFFFFSDKMKEKKNLEEKKETLTAELNKLQTRHSELSISLNDQKTKQEELIMSQQSTENKIQQILTFIENIRKPNGRVVSES